METQNKPRVITIEEHYWDQEVAATFGRGDGVRRTSKILERLYDYDELRIKEMNEAGIDVQVLSHGAPSTQRGDPEMMVKLARGANDRLREIVNAHPDRFAAFACLPTPDPKAAADELERSVTQLGFKGAMVHGLTNGLFFDDKRGLSSSERKPLMFHYTCIRQSPIQPSSRPTTRTISRIFLPCLRRRGASRLRLLLKVYASSFPGSSMLILI